MTAKSRISTALGFKSGPGGPHQARSMMLVELSTLLELVPETGSPEDYRAAVVEANGLAKQTRNNRELTWRHLRDLYGLDPALALFRALRRLWGADPQGRPLLALQCACARDPLLRASAAVVLARKAGDPLTREEMEGFLARHTGRALRPTSLRSFAQNLNGSWTQAGFLKGKVAKTRAHPWAGAANAAYALFTAYLAGHRGEALLANEWTALLDADGETLLRLVEAASQRGLMRLLRVGPVMELRFPGYLTEGEERVVNGQA